MTLQIIHKSPAALRGYERNARTHDDKQIEQIMGSIREFGFNNPILIDETDTIIAGHGRMSAALRLGIESVPCIVLAHLTDAQRRSYILADNKIALNSGWDKKLLEIEMADLAVLDVNLSMLGWSEKELGELLPIEPIDGNTDPDAVPDVPDQPTTKLGDMWILGDHRLICGDSCAPATWDRLLSGEQLAVVWTDPPYNVNYGDKATFISKKDKGNSNRDKILNDHMGRAEFRRFLDAVYAAIFDACAPCTPGQRQHRSFWLGGRMLQGNWRCIASCCACCST